MQDFRNLQVWQKSHRLVLETYAKTANFPRAELFGLIGALLALPVAAMYPCVEDIWLRDYLARDAADTHRKIERQSEA